MSRGKKFKGRKGATNLKETLSASRPEAANKDKDPKGLSIATLAVRPSGFAFLLCCGMLTSMTSRAPPTGPP